MVLAAMLPRDIRHIHAHFMHTPASVARYAARMRDLPWSFSAHAKDIWTSPTWEKAEKLSDCDWAVTCTRANRNHLAGLAPGAEVDLVYHGLDLSRFDAPAPATESERLSPDGSDAANPVKFLSVGRAVEKKGYDDLMVALARLPKALAWRLDHIGGGPLLGRLQEEAARLGIVQNIRWLGAKPQSEVLAAYRAADLFILASRKAADGDMDGLPNVLMEAQSQALAVISTRLSAVPELVDHGETGLLVEPRDVAALANAIEKLARDSSLRRTLGQAGLARVREQFALEPCLEPLARRFGLAQKAAA
jgi:glycosyltransferase involved in cell wall biosynthesis